jgi:hypothetical protein
MGVGGSRGENVYMVAAVATDEPKLVKQSSDSRYRLNFDHGDQAGSGKQGKVLGRRASMASSAMAPLCQGHPQVG